MEVFVLGSGVGVPNLKRSYPGLFLNTGTESILIDPGPGSIRQLLNVGFDYKDLDCIILTHFHPDHCLDLISFLFACKYPLAPRTKNLTLIGALGLNSFYQGILEIFGDAILPEKFKLSLKETQEDKIAGNKTELTIKPVAHSKDSIGIRYRDEYGKILCYSGDTGYCDNIVQLAQEADLLILECSFPDHGEVEGHLTPFYAGRIAREAKAKRTILTHLYPICDSYDILSQCKKEFNGELQIARDLMKIVV
jgi:ribonuclease BN (tRNA processing enzyme)